MKEIKRLTSMDHQDFININKMAVMGSFLSDEEKVELLNKFK